MMSAAMTRCIGKMSIEDVRFHKTWPDPNCSTFPKASYLGSISPAQSAKPFFFYHSREWQKGKHDPMVPLSLSRPDLAKKFRMLTKNLEKQQCALAWFAYPALVFRKSVDAAPEQSRRLGLL